MTITGTNLTGATGRDAGRHGGDERDGGERDVGDGNERPAGTAGTVDVVVTTAGGTGTARTCSGTRVCANSDGNCTERGPDCGRHGGDDHRDESDGRDGGDGGRHGGDER